MWREVGLGQQYNSSRVALLYNGRINILQSGSSAGVPPSPPSQQDDVAKSDQFWDTFLTARLSSLCVRLFKPLTGSFCSTRIILFRAEVNEKHATECCVISFGTNDFNVGDEREKGRLCCIVFGNEKGNLFASICRCKMVRLSCLNLQACRLSVDA